MAGHGRAGPPPDFPPDAAGAEPLRIAWRRHSDPALVRQLDDLSTRLATIHGIISDLQHKDDRRSEHARHKLQAEARRVIAKLESLLQRVTTDLLRKLANGAPAAWVHRATRRRHAVAARASFPCLTFRTMSSGSA